MFFSGALTITSCSGTGCRQNAVARVTVRSPLQNVALLQKLSNGSAIATRSVLVARYGV